MRSWCLCIHDSFCMPLRCGCSVNQSFGPGCLAYKGLHTIHPVLQPCTMTVHYSSADMRTLLMVGVGEWFGLACRVNRFTARSLHCPGCLHTGTVVGLGSSCCVSYSSTGGRGPGQRRILKLGSCKTTLFVDTDADEILLATAGG